MKQLHVMVNGQLMPANKATLYVNDLAIQRGYGIFDFLKTIHGRPIFFEDHLDRFFHSAHYMRLDGAINRPQLVQQLQLLMQSNQLEQSGIKITVTGGYSADGYTMSQPNIIITQQPITLQSFSPNRGIKLISWQHQRQMPTIKTIDYLMAIWLQPYVAEHAADDVLYHFNGVVTECPRANIFAVMPDGQVITPAENMLKGIVRSRLLRHFGSQFNVTEGQLTLNDLAHASEAFITSSTKNVLPVLAVDGNTIGSGNAGPVTAKLATAMEKLIESEAAGTL